MSVRRSSVRALASTIAPGPRLPANSAAGTGSETDQGSPTSRQKVENGRTRVAAAALPKSFAPRCTW